MHNTLYFESLDSTNAWLLANWREVPHLTAVYAGTQGAGRGRLGRTWFSGDAGNLYLSLLIKPLPPSFPCVNMTQYASVALCRCLADFGVPARIKWPNDVLVDGRKIAGILAQLATEHNAPAALVLGLGVNLNARADTLFAVEAMGKGATSLHLHTTRVVSREAFLQRYVEEFLRDYTMFTEKGFRFIANVYEELSAVTGREVTVDNFGKRLTGVVKQFTEQGELLLEDAKGVRHVITVGDLA